MKKYIHSILFLSFALLATASLADDALDTRTSLNLNEVEKNAFFSEMRQMLSSIQGVIMGIGTENRELIIQSARASGNRMARSTPESIRQKLPQSFKKLGAPTHLLFEELVIRADSDDMATLAEFTGQLMRQCLSCHTQFKAN